MIPACRWRCAWRYLVMAVLAGMGVISPRVGAHFLNVEDAGELREERIVLGQS